MLVSRDFFIILLPISLLYMSILLPRQEVRLTRLAEEMKRKLEALRFAEATQADTREREQQQCFVCYDFVPGSAGLVCEGAMIVTASVPIVLRVRYRGFRRQYRRQNLWRDTERKEAA